MPLVHPEDHESGLRYCAQENAGAYSSQGDSVFRLLGKDGYHWMTSAAREVLQEERSYIVSTISDITRFMERKMQLKQQIHTQKEALEAANQNLMRMMQQMQAQKNQIELTNAQNIEKEQLYQKDLISYIEQR